MFTGIISGLGRIVDVQALGADASHGRRLTIEAPAGYLDDVQLGDSIALNGACMTVTRFDPAARSDPLWFGFYLLFMRESAPVTSPLGFSRLLLHSTSGNCILTIARAALRFFLIMIVATLLIVLFPEIAPRLPKYLMGR